jgi:KTSC domain
MSSRHLNPYFHWCAGCWKWVCDCVHCVEPLNITRQPVNDIQIRSLGYDRRRGRLEIEFTWTDDVRQFYPVAPALYRQLLAAKPMYLFLHQIPKPRSVRFQYVRTEAKRAIMMAGMACELLYGFE